MKSEVCVILGLAARLVLYAASAVVAWAVLLAMFVWLTIRSENAILKDEAQN